MNLLEEIAIYTGIGIADAQRIILSAPARYKVFAIKKRTGGFRIIAQPSRELKIIQHYVLEHRLSKLQVHRAAAAYVPGKGIRDNAQIHRANPVILKLDFENFFPSIRTRDWRLYTEKNVPDWTAEIRLLTNILFWGKGENRAKCLSIGAPTSPMISNLLMFELDQAICEKARECGTNYSRYADDITISGQSIDAVVAMEKIIREIIISHQSPKLKINEKKRGIYTKGQRRLVTGLVLTPDGKVSIGRDRKREISALLHKFSLNQLSAEKIGYLKGMIGFTIANEQEFIGRMREKYGNTILDTVLALELPKRIPRI